MLSRELLRPLVRFDSWFQCVHCRCEQLYQFRESRARQPNTDESRLTKTGSGDSRDGSLKERQQSIKVVPSVMYYTVSTKKL